MIVGQCVVHPCALHAYVCALKVDKAGLVCTSTQLQWPHRVDEVLIRALTAGVRRSLGVSRFWLGPWEPEQAWGHEGRVAAEGRSATTWLISLGQCTQHVSFFFSLFLFFFIHIGTHTNAHTSDWAPHRDNSQRFVMARQEGPIVRLNQLLYRKQSLQLKLFAVKWSVS